MLQRTTHNGNKTGGTSFLFSGMIGHHATIFLKKSNGSFFLISGSQVAALGSIEVSAEVSEESKKSKNHVVSVNNCTKVV